MEKVLEKTKVRSPCKAREIVDWLRYKNVRDIARVLRLHPEILGYSIDDNLDPKAVWFEGQGVKDFGSVIQSYPSILTYSLEENLIPTVEWLKGKGVPDINRLILQFPAVFGFSIKNKLDPTVTWMSQVGFREIGKTISRFPPILGLNLSTNLKPTLSILKKEFGLSMAEIEASPMILGASLDRVQTIALWFKHSGLSIKKLSLPQRRKIIQGLQLDILFHHLHLLLLSAQRWVPDPNERSEILAGFLPTIHRRDPKLFPRLLRKYPSGTLPRAIYSRCYEILKLEWKDKLTISNF